MTKRIAGLKWELLLNFKEVLFLQAIFIKKRDILLKFNVPFGTTIYARDKDQESEVIIIARVNYVFF